jgi:hypothetical protein
MTPENENPASATPRSASKDLTCAPGGIFLWCLPTLALIAGEFWPAVRTLLWIPAFLIMGAACLVNASRCGRLHCYISGPVLLLAAAYVALAAFHAVPFVPGILLDAVFALVVLAFLAEIPFGKYRARSQ